MIKRILIFCVLILVSCYIVVAVTVFNRKPAEETCKGMELTITDSVNYNFISQKDIETLLKSKRLLPTGKPTGTVNVRKLEETIAHHPFVSEAQCYLTSGNKVKIDIRQRIPLLRIMSDNGDNYYVDNKGGIMSQINHPVHVAVATGHIDRKFAQKELYELGKYLQSSPFWSAQVEQIHVTVQKELEIVPRVGNHILFLGKAEDYDEKFSKLQTFYKEALNQVGWNKYQRISIEFKNQIIGTKKEK